MPSTLGLSPIKNPLHFLSNRFNYLLISPFDLCINTFACLKKSVLKWNFCQLLSEKPNCTKTSSRALILKDILKNILARKLRNILIIIPKIILTIIIGHILKNLVKRILKNILKIILRIFLRTLSEYNTNILRHILTNILKILKINNSC